MNRITQLRSYHNRKYYSGYIRWLLTDEKGESVLCDKCGSIANGIMKIERTNGAFNIPLCKKHFSQIFPNVEYLPAIAKLEEGRRITPSQHKEAIKQQALSKLTEEEKRVLNLIP